MDNTRRVFLKGALTASALGVVVGSGLMTSRSVLAATATTWPKDAFNTKSLKRAMTLADGADSATPGHVTIQAPDIAENGAVVPITIASELDNVVSLSLYTPDNPFALNSTYEFSDGAIPFTSTRIKLAKTQKVMAIARTADGKLYSATKQIKVTIGGCGG